MNHARIEAAWLAIEELEPDELKELLSRLEGTYPEEFCEAAPKFPSEQKKWNEKIPP